MIYFIIDVQIISYYFISFSFVIISDFYFGYAYVVFNCFPIISHITIVDIISVLSFFFVCFANPGIINDKKYSEKELKEKYKVLRRFNCCQICHICVPETIKIGHCEYCGRCIIEQNHHSFIFGKCIGKYTFFVYFIFISSEIIIVCKIVFKK